MKKYFKVILLLNIIFIFGIKGVRAETLRMETNYIDNVWSFHYRNGSMWTYGQLPFRYVGGKLVYCLQPDARITTNDYIKYEFNRSGYSEETRKQMELISYYGYGYKGHDSIKYYIATQDLLWRFSPDEDIRWTTSSNEYGEEIDISNEKNEIMNLVNNHNKLPWYNNYLYDLLVNQDMELLNGEISNFEVEYDEGLEVIRDGNNLKVTPKEEGIFKIRFKHYENYNEGTYIFDNFNTLTQMVGVFGKPDLVDSEITVRSKSSNITITKKDLETDEIIKDKGIVVKIKDLNTDSYVTDEIEFTDGIIELKLPVSRYLIEEIKTSDGYKLNEGLEFTIVNQEYLNLDFYNEKEEIPIITPKDEKEYIMPVTSKELDLSFVVIIFDILGYVFIKKYS